MAYDYNKLRADIISSYETIPPGGDKDVCETQALFAASYAEIAVAIAKLWDTGKPPPHPSLVVHAIITGSVFGMVNLLPNVSDELHDALRAYALSVLRVGIDPNTEHVVGPEVAMAEKAN
jgi:hypothetical protein